MAAPLLQMVGADSGVNGPFTWPVLLLARRRRRRALFNATQSNLDHDQRQPGGAELSTQVAPPGAQVAPSRNR